MFPGGNTTHNRLWQARRRRGLRQKQVALLLKHHTKDQVSRYEKGERVPTLETALKLEIIYRVPLRLLFADQYRQMQADIQQGIAVMHSTVRLSDESGAANLESEGEFCTWADRLDVPSISQAELIPVRRHITDLAKRYAHLQL